MRKKYIFVILLALASFFLLTYYAYSDDNSDSGRSGFFGRDGHRDDHRGGRFGFFGRDGHRDGHRGGRFGFFGRNNDREFGDVRGFSNNGMLMGVSAEASKLYQDECGSCHFAFQPSFLPQASWRKMMSGLADHFDDNAEIVDEEDHRKVLDFLVSQSSPENVGSNPPLRITELAGFLDEHDEIPRRLISNNPEVNSLANCEACHTRAAQGSFDEDEVVIAGFGRWED